MIKKFAYFINSKSNLLIYCFFCNWFLLYFSHDILQNKFFTILFQFVFVFIIATIMLGLILNEIFKKDYDERI